MRRVGPMFLVTLMFAWVFSISPWSVASAQNSAELFDLTDIDKSGSIDREEYRKRMVEVFYFDDKNKDGFLDIKEISSFEKIDPKAFRKADKNGDGKLTLQEFVDYRMIQFDEADTNKDGVLTYEEVEAWRARSPD
jgi:Ca2+-binding EF-hand superfamily protein